MKKLQTAREEQGFKNVWRQVEMYVLGCSEWQSWTI